MYINLVNQSLNVIRGAFNKLCMYVCVVCMCVYMYVGFVDRQLLVYKFVYFPITCGTLHENIPIFLTN